MTTLASFSLLVALVVLFVFQEWFAYRTRLSLREGRMIRRALFRGEAFAHKYRTWKFVYREILDIGGDKL